MNARNQLLAVAAALLSSLSSADIDGKVVSIADGDTLTVLDAALTQHKIRLAQIDAPESKMPFGQKSKQSLSDLVYLKQVHVVATATDRYQRTVGTVFVGQVDVNLEQVRRGMAWVYRQYAKDARYFDAEAKARSSKVGLWADDNNPVPPWEFRHGQRSTGTYESPKSSHNVTPGECGSKHRCSQMTSCDEARHYLTDCHVQSLDKDGDGVPCESLCRQ